jgi:hypothetical protein
VAVRLTGPQSVMSAAVNAHLIAEDIAQAVEKLRNDPFSAASEARVTELVLGDRRDRI